MGESIENRIYETIKRKLERKVKKSKDLKNALLLVHSEKLKIHWKFSFGITGENQDLLRADNPYHIASIGKTFTALIIAKSYERGKITFTDPIYKYLSSEMLKGLFIYRGIDYHKEVLVNLFYSEPKEKCVFKIADVYIIGSFNHSNYVVKQVFFLIDVMRNVSKVCR